jgi:hypothetical protein
LATQPIQEHEGAVYYDLSSMPEWVSAYTVTCR